MVKEIVERRGIKLGTYMSSGGKKGSSEYNTGGYRVIINYYHTTC
jgi:hypothetical protein